MRELSWGLIEVKRDARDWQRLAERIPAGPLREDALTSLARKRGNVVGAALFSTLPGHRNIDLLRTLATFQTIFDFLDEANERHVDRTNGIQLHMALVEALDPNRPLSDHFRHHPWKEDRGYLRALVEGCRSACVVLPSYERLRSLLIREATRAQHVLAMNHLPRAERDLALRRWAEAEFPEEADWPWFELAAAASGQLAIFALIALAAEPGVSDEEIAAVYRVYWPRLPLIATMLDSYVDQSEDEASGDHLYVGHYPDADHLVARITELVSEAARDLLTLRNGHGHTVVMSCMMAFYLAKRSARAREMKSMTRRLIRASGTLTLTLVPILRAWRIAYSQSSA